MALPVTDQLITQMMREDVNTQPTTPMEGNVSRPLIISDLLSTMKDVNFNQLVKAYGSMAGMPSESSTPITKALMAEKPKVPTTPLQEASTPTPSAPPTQPTAPPPTQPTSDTEIQVPTPVLNAMNTNTLAPTDSVVEQKGGLMKQSKGLQKTT